ncbi:MAG TPA: hypothetical protein VGI74_13890 [Streptosporangiaceae bacterium]
MASPQAERLGLDELLDWAGRRHGAVVDRCLSVAAGLIEEGPVVQQVRVVAHELDGPGEAGPAGAC